MSAFHVLSRRQFIGATVGALASTATPAFAKRYRLNEADREFYADVYGPLLDEPFPIPAVDLDHLDPIYLRRSGDYATAEQPGTVIVDTTNRVLFLTLPEGKAIRYGIGIGRAGFEWSGRAVIKFKRAWPTWTPPAEMIDRQPELAEWRYGMPPGLDNPLGARALYIYKDGVDTLYRLHGNGDVNSIGKAVSSGCVRLLHHDVIDLYRRVPDDTPIVVM
ncbi:MAG: L,D-transpeptidase [Devosia sp.]|nr:L,D-transpeptidase [Devosia sp.]